MVLAIGNEYEVPVKGYKHNNISNNGARTQQDSSYQSERTPLTSHGSDNSSSGTGSKSENALHFQQDVRKNRSGSAAPNKVKNSYYTDGNGSSKIGYSDEGANNKTASLTSNRPESPSEMKVEPKKRKSGTNCTLPILASAIALLLCLGALLFETGNAWIQGVRSRKSQSPAETPLFDNVGRYVLEDYDTKTPFSDFLPGLAGIYGKPLYVFLVNRGQAIASFGIESKDYPIMEFQAANKAYQSTPLLGFRTFIQGTRNSGRFLVEPYSPLTTNHPNVPAAGSIPSILGVPPPRLPKRVMYSGENEIQLQELDFENRLETNVTYFVLPEEDFGAFVRRTTITNTDSRESVTLAVLDGLAKMEPAGGRLNVYLKNLGQTLEGYMGVHFPDDESISMPFYRLTTKPGDTAKVHVQERGHYCLSFLKEGQGVEDRKSLLPIVYDTSKVFGEDTTLLKPVALYSKTVRDIVRGPQYGQAKTSSCFAAVESITLGPGETATISSMYGAADHIHDLPAYAQRIVQEGFVQYKLTRTREIIRQITKSVATRTSHKLFDAHIQQMFLDNSLRGGIPLVLGDQDDINGVLTVDEDPRLKVFHVFSRIHGDLERDYNDFMLSPTFFSQGPGNFRDVVQNRRDDVVFNPRIGSFNVRMFLSFIQADGYEPLSIEAVIFTIVDEEACNSIAERAVGLADGHRAQREALSGILTGGPFRPGQLFGLIEEQNIELMITKQELIDMVAIAAESIPMAVYETGFWADHWTYYMDMIRSYLSIFPDGEEELMFAGGLPYFFSPASVQPRSKKYVLSLSMDGYHHHVQQLDATIEDAAKRKHMDAFRSPQTGWYEPTAHWQKCVDDNTFESAPAAKLLLLGTIKFATRDAYGMGIEYEAGRPGWDDANNGMAGMLGSGMPETFELKVLLQYVLDITERFGREISIPIELKGLIDTINSELQVLDDYYEPVALPMTVPTKLFDYWDKVSTAREEYREKVKVTFSGSISTVPAAPVTNMLKRWLTEVDRGIARAMAFGTHGFGDEGHDGITPTYFAFNVTKHRLTGQVNRQGHPLVFPDELQVSKFPLFLEGPTRMMKTVVSSTEARDIYQHVRGSRLRDAELSMYTVSASLEGQPIDMGRTMAFPPGWLENQSVWLHMSYKFYLELLRHELYDTFFAEVTSGGLLPFMKSEQYGRSLMQCSSFIASSAFEDPSKHGRGYMARLSGSTAEFLSMWILMFIGPEPFFLDKSDGTLRMQLKPSLPSWLFEIRDSKTDLNSFVTDEPMFLQQAQQKHPETPTLSFKLFSSINVHYYNKGAKDLFGMVPSRYRIGLRDGSMFEIDGPTIPTDLADKIRRVVFVDFIEAYF